MKTAHVVAAIALWASFSVQAVRAGDWTQWRGPQRAGWAPEFAPPDPWPQKLAKRWQVAVGSGHASPLVAGDQVYVFTRLKDREGVARLSLDSGETLWRQDYPAPYTMHGAALGHGKGPKATPVLHQGKLYTLGISGILTCFDADEGKVLWQHKFADQFERTSPAFGAAASPLVAAGLLVVHVGGKDDGALAAFDAENGQPRWRWDGDGPGYASAVVVRSGDTEQLVTQTQQHCVGIELHSGRVLWKIPYTTPYEQNVITPIARGDTVIFSGLEQGTVALRLRQDQGQWRPETLWKNPQVGFYMSSPLYHQGALFGLAHQRKGQFVCLDSKDGTLLWHSEGRQAESAALIGVGPMLLAVTTAAEAVAFAADSEGFKPQARQKIADGPVWAHPAPLADGFLVKDEGMLIRWGWN